MNKLYVTDINGRSVEVTDIDKALKECDMCLNSPFVMHNSKFTVGDNNRHIKPQLLKLRKERNENISGNI